VPLLAVDVPVDTAAAVVPADAKAVAKALDRGTEAKNRIAAVALLGDRLTALHAVQADRAKSTAQYQEACAGKVSSAGFLIRGVLVTTANEETPACRAIAADLVRQTTAFDLEHKAIVETAHQRDLPRRAPCPLRQ
jgi:hypothetical protein